MQTAIPCLFMRGGTSRGPFFAESDLPEDPALRDRVLLAAMGSPDTRQIDGLGGADPLTSKVGIVGRSSRPGVDLDFLFAQVLIDEARVDTTPNCGNMLAAVGPFALERGLIPARGAETTVRILTRNTGMLSDVVLQTPDGRITYEGSARIDGVPGTSAPIRISFLDTAGSVCGKLLPTGRAVDTFDGVPVTCIDNGMPVVVLRASDLGRTGYESRDALNADVEFKARLESIRLQAGPSDESRRRDEEGRPEDVADRAAAHGRQPLLADVHSARLPLRGRRPRRGDGRHGGRDCRARWRTASPGCRPGTARCSRSNIRPASSPSNSRSIPRNPRSVLVPRCCAPRGSSCEAKS